MKSIKTKINNNIGLHARPASLLVKEANTFQSDVNIINGSKKANGKSIIGILALQAKYGDEIIIDVEGIDEEACIAKLVELVEAGFGEK
ncbi:HPr family phosphocarrier protein [Alkaliphilus peptidifermentans]|uniref:Phosphocarrier protein HPr n=1 Tax=Alkaliphilus peptidifermentans DSM 18978 TaxID=1120976 RepID=A0A1G5KN81_9FIRM|nr:HPr family phosphocarrier protein [Alkaliphilus peptidifermentans]SCZ02022.1 phosphocarrier protein [Alkaliphilus peptidifermentans DSM 18978]